MIDGIAIEVLLIALILRFFHRAGEERRKQAEAESNKAFDIIALEELWRR